MSFVIQRGHGMPIYSGEVRRQVGGSIFASLKRMVFPLAKSLFSFMKPHLAKFGKKAANEAVRVGSHVMGDVMTGNFKNIPETLKEESKNTLNQFSEDYIGQKIFQKGSGTRRHQPKRKAKTTSPLHSVTKTINKRKRKQASKGIKKATTRKIRDIFS